MLIAGNTRQSDYNSILVDAEEVSPLAALMRMFHPACRLIIIVRALYGLKSSGAAWRAHLANTLYSMGFTSRLADPDVWFCPATKPNGFQYYEYVLAYVDDILAISHDAHKILFT
jgi:hypothetical protein